MHDVKSTNGEIRSDTAGAVARGAAPLQGPARDEARSPASGRESSDGRAAASAGDGAACPKCGGPAAPPAPLLTAEDVLDLEVGRSELRVLRELLRAGSAGLGARDILTAIYIKWPDCTRRVARGMRTSYAKLLLRNLREGLRELELGVVATEHVGRRPVRWALLPLVENPAPTRLAPVQASDGGALRTAMRELPRMAGVVVYHISEAGAQGIGSTELVRRVYPEHPPVHAQNSISVLLTEARIVLARHGLAIVTRPRAGVHARRYLEKMR